MMVYLTWFATGFYTRFTVGFLPPLNNMVREMLEDVSPSETLLSLRAISTSVRERIIKETVDPFTMVDRGFAWTSSHSFDIMYLTVFGISFLSLFQDKMVGSSERVRRRDQVLKQTLPADVRRFEKQLNLIFVVFMTLFFRNVESAS